MSKSPLVALRDAREKTITILTEHFAHDLFDVDEFERRVDLAHRAASPAELEELTADLPAPASRTAALVPVAAATAVPDKRRAIAVMGGVERKGNWVVGRRMLAVGVMGGVDLDFRDCAMPPGVTELKVYALMGAVDIIVPPNLAVDADGFAIMGGFDDLHRAPVQPDPDAPLLRIRGMALMGGVGIEMRLPGESAWDARKRRRRQRKEQRKELERARSAGELGPGDK